MASDAPPQKRRKAANLSPCFAFTLRKSITMELTKDYYLEIPMDFRKATQEHIIDSDEFHMRLHTKASPCTTEQGIKVYVYIKRLQSKKYGQENLALEAGVIDKSDSDPDPCSKFLTVLNLGTSMLIPKMKFMVENNMVDKFAVWFKITLKNETIKDDLDFADTLRTRVKPLDVSLQLYDSRDSTGDSTIKAKSEAFKVHQCVLSARSEVFMAMLNTDMKEGREKVINMEHFDDDVVRSSIEYMYLGCTRALVDDPESLLELAHMYLLKDLLSKCWNNLINILSPETTVKLLLLAEKHGDVDQRNRIAKYLLGNHEAVMSTPMFATLIKQHSDLYLTICKTPVEH